MLLWLVCILLTLILENHFMPETRSAWLVHLSTHSASERCCGKAFWFFVRSPPFAGFKTDSTAWETSVLCYFLRCLSFLSSNGFRLDETFGYPPPLLAINQVRTKNSPPPNWMRQPPLPCQCMAVAKYLAFVDKSSFLFLFFFSPCESSHLCGRYVVGVVADQTEDEHPVGFQILVDEHVQHLWITTVFRVRNVVLQTQQKEWK